MLRLNSNFVTFSRSVNYVTFRCGCILNLSERTVRASMYICSDKDTYKLNISHFKTLDLLLR